VAVEVSLLVDPCGKFPLECIIRAIPGQTMLCFEEIPQRGALLAPAITVRIPRETGQLVQEILLPDRHASLGASTPLVSDPVGKQELIRGHFAFLPGFPGHCSECVKVIRQRLNVH